MLDGIRAFLRFNGSEEEIRRREEESLRAERERRQLARQAIAQRLETEARSKKQTANYILDPDRRRELLNEAQKEQRSAEQLKSGEIGFLEAMGVYPDS
jgi:hypothetical protein